MKVANCHDSTSRLVAERLADVLVEDPTVPFDPRGHFVYLLWGDDPDTPIYVGQTGNVMARVGQHMTTEDRRHLIRNVTLLRCKSERHRRLLEGHLIKHHQPPLNVKGVAAP